MRPAGPSGTADLDVDRSLVRRVLIHPHDLQLRALAKIDHDRLAAGAGEAPAGNQPGPHNLTVTAIAEVSAEQEAHRLVEFSGLARVEVHRWVADGASGAAHKQQRECGQSQS